MAKMTYKKGFTIVELLIVIAIIGILSIIIIVAYNGVTRNASISLLEAELSKASRQLDVDRVANGGIYPDTMEEADGGKGVNFADQAELMYTPYNDQDPANYCLTASIGDIIYHISRETPPKEGYCEDHAPIGITEPPQIATMSDSTSQITVSWEAVEEAETYALEWSTSEDFSGVSSEDEISGLQHVVGGLSQDTTYYFRAYAVNSAGTSQPSEVVSETTQLAAPAGAPTISTPVVNSASQITVSWSTIAGTTNYRLQRSTSSSFSSPTNLDGTTTSRAVTGLSAGVRYYFRVYAINGSGTSAASNSVNAITNINAPDSPTVAVSIPGSARAASSGPWAKTPQGEPTSGTWYYAQAALSSSTCASGTTREFRARIQYNSPTTWGAWTGWTTSTSFYAIGPLSGYGIRFQVQSHCKTSLKTSSSSSSSYGCRWRSGSTTCSGF